MKDTLDNIELRSESVQDILASPPKWIIRWGNTLVFLILILILIISYIIKYPEFVAAPIVVTSENPPEKIEARINSRIEKIFIKDHQNIRKGEIIMVLQSTGNYSDILKLKNSIEATDASNLRSFPLSECAHFKLGELQGEYNNFAKAFQDETLFSRLQPYAPEDLATNQSISESKGRIASLQLQKKMEQTKYDLSKKNYQRSQELFSQGVIAAMEMENEKIKYVQAQQSLENINLSISQLPY